MKHTLLIITALMLMLGCSSEPIDVDKLVERGGLLYEVNSDKPFSGEVVLYHANGQKETEGTLKDGELDGLWTGWYENGQKGLEGTHKNGERDGLWTGWYENGQKSGEATFKDGELISEKCWDQDGDECECSEWGPGCD
mgnify:CR=1 FL=1